MGYDSLGIELDAAYFRLAQKSIPRLAALYPDFTGSELERDPDYGPVPEEDEKRMGLSLSEPAVPYQLKHARR